MTSVLLVSAVSAAVAQLRVGGDPIAYDTYTGKATITKIGKTDRSKANNAHFVKYEGYEVSFKFKPDKPAKTDLAKEIFKSDFEFMLNEGSTDYYPGEKYIKKYGIKVGNVYPCIMKVIRSGTATPCSYELEGLNPEDNFEKDDKRALEDIKPINESKDSKKEQEKKTAADKNGKK